MYVHDEKLIFLLRREAEDEKDMEVFKPAEWRWHIPQINDNEWHHYAISVDFPEVINWLRCYMCLDCRCSVVKFPSTQETYIL